MEISTNLKLKKMQDLKENEWQVYGRCCPKPDPLKPDAPLEASEDGPITIEEEVSNLGFRRVERTPPDASKRTANESFGRAIEAQLAVNLIKVGFDNARHHFIGDDEKTHDDTKHLLSEILNLNYGITFDRTTVLKILSQPNCEGLRSYLCYRGVFENCKPHYSLVLVGVDKDGYDLSYYPLTNDVKAGTPIKTTSMVAEYGHPPDTGIDISFHGDVVINEHYFVLNYINS
jgi:hypothetical protein